MSLEINFQGRKQRGIKVVFIDGSERVYVGANNWSEEPSTMMAWIEHEEHKSEKVWWGTRTTTVTTVLGSVNMREVRRIENFYEGD